MFAIRIILLTLACLAPVAGNTPLSPIRHVVARGEYFFVIDPEDHDPPVGIAYQATSDGFKQLWKSEGWYGWSNELFLAPDGMSLVRIKREACAPDGAKIADAPVIFFYYKGRLVKEQKLSAVVKEMSSLFDLSSLGGSGSIWMNEAEIVQSDIYEINTDRKDEKPDEQTFRSYNHFTLRLITLEGAELFFDLLDGKLIERRLPKVVGIKENDNNSGDPFAEQTSESGRREVLTPAPHTTGHTDP